MTQDEFIVTECELTADEIMAATRIALEFAQEVYGEKIDAKSIDLRLWAAAALIDSAIRVSLEPNIMQSLAEKLAVLRGSAVDQPRRSVN